jgi:hypothetical protein
MNLRDKKGKDNQEKNVWMNENGRGEYLKMRHKE